MRTPTPLDTSFLPAADFMFVVMTDTHHMLDPGSQRIEFESRRHQSARAEYALGKIATLDRAFVVHLGDLVQEFPEGPGFEESLAIALDAFKRSGVEVRQVAGNHDVGDKPDPTMPTEWATQETLDNYHRRFGPSWTSWNEGGCHFVILNSQILNGPLPAVDAQREWLEQDLAMHGRLPTCLFLHLSPFLVEPHEPGLGHYDNIDEPARSWLLDLIHRHNIRMVFSGHSHFGFFNRIGQARSYLVPSTAFTRPGFCEVFSSAPPPERGRDDAPKLGFYAVSVHDGELRVRLVRTGGRTAATPSPAGARQLVTAVTADLPTSPLGVTMRQPLAPVTEVPIAWQSTVRQPVRNDFPLLACLELGVRYVRVPWTDLTNPVQRERLAILRDEGVAITAFRTWMPNGTDVAALVDEHLDVLDGIELQIPNALVPNDECLEAIRSLTAIDGLSVSLAPLLPHERVPGKQHARTRIGYHFDELAPLNLRLKDSGIRLDRVLCRLDAGQSPAEVMRRADPDRMTEIGACDWAIEFAEGDRALQTPRAAGAMVEVAAHAGSRLYLEPLIDMDRTMDAPPGILTRLCNPNPVFAALRTLNTVLFRNPGSWQVDDVKDQPGMKLTRDDEQILVQFSQGDHQAAAVDWPPTGYTFAHRVFLEEGTIDDARPEGDVTAESNARAVAYLARRTCSP
jgi:hypothetical protein